jgi:hypothetical protein
VSPDGRWAALTRVRIAESDLVRVDGFPDEGWCRRWDLNAFPASTASDSIHSGTENEGASTDAPVDREDHADSVQGQIRDGDPEADDR